MKVGILTFHNSYNFGANLQTLAVQELFRSNGFQPIVIDYRDSRKAEMQQSQVVPVQADMHERFVQRYLSTSPRFYSVKEVQEYCNDELDVVSVGSDQVFRVASKWAPCSLSPMLFSRAWRSSRDQLGNVLPVYYLPWPKNGSKTPYRVAMAACAVGTSSFFLGRTLRLEACKSLQSFDFISVRDDWSRIVVTWLSRGRVALEHCPDPVLSLRDCFSIPSDEISDRDVSRTILLAGPFDGTWHARFRSIAHDHGYTVSNLPDPDKSFAFCESDFSIDLPLSPLRWYMLLANAAGYVGMRYHALVSCVANRTPVVSLNWSNRPRLLKMACRKYDLCRKAGVRRRCMAVNWLQQPSPQTVFKELLDGTSQTAMNQYAEKAKVQLQSTMQRIMTRVSHVWER